MTYPLGKDPLEGKPCETCPDYATNCAAGCTREGDGHDSDCATHDAPAYPTGECDCSAQDDATRQRVRELFERLPVMSLSAARAAIDAAMQEDKP